MLVGFAAIGIELDLLPLGSALVLAALLPLALARESLTTGQHRPAGS